MVRADEQHERSPGFGEGDVAGAARPRLGETDTSAPPIRPTGSGDALSTTRVRADRPEPRHQRLSADVRFAVPDGDDPVTSANPRAAADGRGWIAPGGEQPIGSEPGRR